VAKAATDVHCDNNLPKSQSLMTWVSGLRSRFCGLTSRWQMPREWMYARHRNNWYMYSCVSTHTNTPT